MSLSIDTFVPSVQDSQISLWLARMAALGMFCEIHPKFSFTTQSGFLPFKLQIRDSAHRDLNGVDFLAGFEYYMVDFILDEELQVRKPKAGLFARIFGKKTQRQFYATPEIDEQLKQCRKRLQFVWGSADLFELRMATVSSAVLAEITGGLSNYPADGLWYERNTAAARAVSEARDYENSINASAIKVHRFEQWL